MFIGYGKAAEEKQEQACCGDNRECRAVLFHWIGPLNEVGLRDRGMWIKLLSLVFFVELGFSVLLVQLRGDLLGDAISAGLAHVVMVALVVPTSIALAVVILSPSRTDGAL